MGVVVTAVITSAVWLPSGAMTAFEVTAQGPPFLSRVVPVEMGKGSEQPERSFPWESK